MHGYNSGKMANLESYLIFAISVTQAGFWNTKFYSPKNG